MALGLPYGLSYVVCGIWHGMWLAYSVWNFAWHTLCDMWSGMLCLAFGTACGVWHLALHAFCCIWHGMALLCPMSCMWCLALGVECGV